MTTESGDKTIENGRISIDSDVLSHLEDFPSPVAAQLAMNRVRKKLSKSGINTYIQIVSPGTAEERAKLLPKTDKALESYEIQDSMHRAIFGVVIGEKEGMRPLPPRAQQLQQSSTPISLADATYLMRSILSMKEILLLKNIWEFMDILHKDLHMHKYLLRNVYEAIPSGYSKQEHTQYRDYLQFLIKLWPENFELLNAIKKFKVEEQERTNIRKGKRAFLKQWHAMDSDIKLNLIKERFPQKEWDLVHARGDILDFEEKIKEQFGIGPGAFQSFLFDIARPQQELFANKPGWHYPSRLNPSWFHYFHLVVWGVPHPDKR